MKMNELDNIKKYAEEYAEAEDTEFFGKTDADLDEDFKEILSAEENGEKTSENMCDDKEKSGKKFSEYTVSSLYALSEEFPNENVAEDIMSEGFRVFSGGRRGEASEVYSDYLKLKKYFSDKENSAQPSARAHSSFGSPSARSASSVLTRRQMDIAKASGMSYREYAELLEGLPKSKKI